jgi:probable HAF family extracellular repeat protein
MKTTQHVVSALLFCLGLTLSAQASGPYQLTDLGDPPGGYDWSHAYDINDLGQVVGDMGDNEGVLRSHAFLWTSSGGMQDLGVLPGRTRSVAWGINDAAQVVGISEPDSFEFLKGHAFLWTSSGGMQDLGDLIGGNEYSQAWDISDAGHVVGQAGNLAFLWSSTNGTQNLGVSPGNTYSSAYGVNNAGQVVGNSYDENTRGFLWSSGGGMQDLGGLPGGLDGSGAVDINDSGQIVGVSGAATGPRAFLWTNGVMQDLGDLPGGLDSSGATAINDAAQVVGASGAATGDRPVLWTNSEGMQDLNSLLDPSGTGWNLVRANAINNAGQIVGFGFDPMGQGRAFLLTPIPEPSTLAMTSCALVLLALYHLRRGRRRRGETK